MRDSQIPQGHSENDDNVGITRVFFGGILLGTQQTSFFSDDYIEEPRAHSTYIGRRQETIRLLPSTTHTPEVLLGLHATPTVPSQNHTSTPKQRSVYRAVYNWCGGVCIIQAEEYQYSVSCSTQAANSSHLLKLAVVKYDNTTQHHMLYGPAIGRNMLPKDKLYTLILWSPEPLSTSHCQLI